MKKNLKQILATAFAGLLAFATFGATAPTVVKAAEESTETYKVFVAFGGDVAEENDWGYQYYGQQQHPNGDKYNHPDMPTLAHIVTGGTGRELYFNYPLSICDELKKTDYYQEFNFEVIVPENGKGIIVTL